MDAYKDRVRAEAAGLREKLLKLVQFIGANPKFSILNEVDQELLRQQRDSMIVYLDVLDRRIARFA